MTPDTAQISKPVLSSVEGPLEITADELRAAYRASKLRYKHIGFLMAIETPALYSALRGFALMIRKQQHGKHAPDQQALQIGEKEYA